MSATPVVPREPSQRGGRPAPMTERPGPAGSVDRLPYLDGLRGFAALWVVMSHTLELTGGRFPMVSRGYLAVDLFMVLSGFLMAFHYRLREQREPWEAPRTWLTFWSRRYFRIAPVFYVLLAIALACGPWLGEWRHQIAAAFPRSATLPERYLDRSAENIASHVTFLFGALPRLSFNTPLPDWSIGLEMQFYAAFPFLMLVLRLGALRSAAVLVAVCLALPALAPNYFSGFAMPSMLVLKLDLFVAGMLLAASLQRRNAGALIAAAMALPLAELWRHGDLVDGAARVLLVAGMAVLVHHRRLSPLPLAGPPVVGAIRLLDSPAGRFLGDTSYGVYLLHLLVLLPLIGALSLHPAFVALGGASRFTIAIALAAIPVYGGGWLLLHLIERPGIALGRRVVGAARSGAVRQPAL